MMNSTKSEQWLSGGDCKLCRSSKYCSKACKANKEARGENCFDVVNGRYVPIKSYEKYRSVVLKSRDKKNKRYGDK